MRYRPLSTRCTLESTSRALRIKTRSGAPLLLCLAAFIMACSQTTAEDATLLGDPSKVGPYPVGNTTITVEGPSDPYVVEVWYLCRLKGALNNLSP